MSKKAQLKLNNQNYLFRRFFPKRSGKKMTITIFNAITTDKPKAEIIHIQYHYYIIAPGLSHKIEYF